MKKLLMLLILLACTFPLALAEAPAPRVGDVVHGFELIDIQPYPLVGGTYYRFAHQRTGAELFYLANNDIDRAFSLTFRTQAIDNTGLPHVFEHATLNGSEKYPSRDLWINLSNGSYNTYMNAMTGQNQTDYPVASLSEAQLLKLADLYVDCCLHPLVMTDERIFREEAWRYRLGSMDEPITIEGTVYSEMLGAVNLERKALYDFIRLALPGSYSGNVSGGMPEAIPELTYESLKSYHQRYYHPSNSIACLYGRFEDYTAFLKLLDDAYAPYEAEDFVIQDPGYTPITGPVEGVYEFPVAEGTDTQDASAVIYGVVCPELRNSIPDKLAFDTLCSLMNADGSNLYQSLMSDFPRASFNFSINTLGPDDVFTAFFDNVNPEDAQAIRDRVVEGLRDIAENGFSREMIESVMAGLEISSRLMVNESGIGVTLMSSLLDSYIATDDPWYSLKWGDALDHIEQWNQDGTYARLIEDYLLSSDLTVLSVTKPAPGGKEAADAALADRLAQLKADMSPEELNALIEASNAETEENPETARMIAELTAVTVQSLPEESREYPMTDVTGEDGVRRIDVTSGMDGIGGVDVYLDASAVPQEDLHWLKLYITLIGDMDTARHDYQALTAMEERYLYGLDTSLIAQAPDDGFYLRLDASWLALDEDLKKSYDLLREILFETAFDNIDQLTGRVQGYRTAIKTNTMDAPYGALIARGLSKHLAMNRFAEYYSGLSYYDFLGEVERQLEADPQSVVQHLRTIQDYFNNSYGLVLGYSGSAAGSAANRAASDAFAASLDYREHQPAHYDLPIPEENSAAMIVDAAVQSNGIALDFKSLGMKDGFEPEIEVVNKLVGDLYLYPQLRDQYGAYGVTMGTDSESSLYLFSNRDPNVAQSFEVYDALPDFVESLEVDQKTIDRYILSIYTGYAMPVGELSGAMAQLANHLIGFENEDLLEEMRAVKSVTPETVRRYADTYRKLVEQGYRFTAGSAAAINENSALYDVILNPFGAEESSGMAFSDLSEDSDAYEAARFTCESGLMDVREDGSFGADDPANLGDVSVALLALIGEVPSADDAVYTLTAYGILPEDAQVDDLLTAESCEETLVRFSQVIEVDYPGDMAVPAEPFTRAALAQTLQAYAGWLNGPEESNG